MLNYLGEWMGGYVDSVFLCTKLSNGWLKGLLFILGQIADLFLYVRIPSFSPDITGDTCMGPNKTVILTSSQY